MWKLQNTSIYRNEGCPILRTLFRPSDRLLLGLLTVGALVYAYINLRWNAPMTVLILLAMVMVIERFPVQLGKANYTFTFPILYAMALTTGFSATALLSAAALGLANLTMRKSRRAILFNVCTRFVSVAAAGAVGKLLLLNLSPTLGVLAVHLIISSVVFTAVSTLLVLRFLRSADVSARYSPLLWKMAVINLLFTWGYDFLMLFLASDPRNTGTGDWGILFFYLPLVAITIVLHLFTNLARAKSSLETLFAVSQSINRQRDLDAVLHHVVREAHKLTRADFTLLYLAQDDGSLKKGVGVGTPDPYATERLPWGVGLAGAVAQNGEALLVHDVDRDGRYRFGETDADTRSLLVVPIQIDAEVAGVISLGKKETHSFRSDDLKTMSIFAAHAAVAMKNALYIEEREKRLLVEERNRLAREIHDGLAQDLAGAILEIEMMKRRDPEDWNGSLGQLQSRLRQTVSTVRRSIYSLRPAPYTHVGLIPALRAQVEETAVQHGLRTHFDGELRTAPLPPCVSRAVYAIATESIQNAVKHAKARSLIVTLREADGQLKLSVRDDGIGFHFGQAILHAAERHSFGIENLHALADQVGGTLDFVTAPNAGTEVILEIQLEEEEIREDDDDTRPAL